MSKTPLKAAFLVGAFLLFAAAAFSQQVNLTAGPATTTMPDGTVIPMWGYTCGAVASGATCAPLSGSSSGAATGSLGGIYVLNGGSGYTSAPTVTITPATGNTPTTPAVATAIVTNGQVVGFNVTNHGAGYTAAPTVTLTFGGGSGATAAAAPAWSPVVITVPFVSGGASLTINLNNILSFPVTGGGPANNFPTSIVIIGQVGGGLGNTNSETYLPSPDHSNAQGCPTWFIAANPPGTPCTSSNNAGLASPPVQGQGRVWSMAQEVEANPPGTGAPQPLAWNSLRPGTYLLESGTHPSIQVPMGLIGMLVVTNPPTSATAPGTAYPAVAANTKTAAVQAAVPAVQYNAELPLEFSEIDPVQNTAVDVAVRNPNFSELRVWSGLPTDPQGGPGCGNPASGAYYQSCYPPAVNYTPFYYLINGLAFNKTNPGASLFKATAGTATTGISGTVLVRMVNAGLRMHVPAIVGSQTTGYPGTGTSTSGQGSTQGPVQGFTLIAEDGNPLPNLTAPRVKTELFMAAGKTYDVKVNVPAASLPIYDRELSLSANSSVRDAGMLAYISVNGALLPNFTGTPVGQAATANPDTYASVIPCGVSALTCTPLVITDPSKGVIANDINVYGVELSTPPNNGTLTCNAVSGNPVSGICANGTFTYTPTPGWSADTFVYCANGSPAVPPSPGTSPSLCATVALNPSTLTGAPVAHAITYTSTMATFIKIPSPGVLSVDSDPSELPLTVVLSGASAPKLTGGTLLMDPQGGFTASVTGAGTTACPTGAPTGSNCFSFSYRAQNSQGTASGPAVVTLVFPPPSNLQVNVLDAQAYNNCNGKSACISALTPFTDYRWIIEEDKTFWVDPNCTANSSITTPGCPAIVGPSGTSTIPTFGVNFHTSAMDFVAQGCTGPLSCEGGQTMLDTNPLSSTFGQHISAVCDLGNGACRPDPTGGNGSTEVKPSEVHLDPSKRYYISVLPGDAANPFPSGASPAACNGIEAQAGDTTCGHAMSGAPIPPACNILGGTNACTTSSAFTQPVNVLALPSPLPTGSLSVVVFEDDFPLNGEQDNGGGVDALSPVEPGLGGFNLILWDTFGGLGDFTGQDTNDMFNQPLSNSLAGTIDPTTGFDACPLTPNPLSSTGAVTLSNGNSTGGLITGNGAGPAQTVPMTGMIVTCPKFESDGKSLSPLAGQAVIANLMPDKFSVQAYPGADRIARGEEWVQTNTLDGQHPHDAFIAIGGPSYFQEYGPAGYHVMIGFANPKIINDRHNDVCSGVGSPGLVGPCTNTIDGQVDVQRLSRIPDERLYPSGSRDAFAWTQCWVSLGDPDGEDFMFTKCDANGNFKFTNVPGGTWRLAIGDQWNDQIIDGLSTPANVGCTSTAPNQTNPTCPGGQTLHMGNIGVQQWQSNVYTRTFIDDNKNGIWDPGEIGIPLIYTMVHYRDGHNANSLTTDFNGVAPFNETFPLFNWYVVEADSTRYKTTGIHTVYDAGGPADGSPSCGTGNGARACGTSTAYNSFSNTFESVPLPADLSVPGAVYCSSADCSAEAASFLAGTAIPSSPTASTGRIDPPWVWSEGWAGLTGHSNWIDFGKAPYASCPPACTTVTTKVPGATTSTTKQVGENGGIYGTVVYASTRPFDDASQMIQQPWQSYVPNVTVNLYQEGFAADGVTPTLTLVDTTKTSSWDAWAQGFYPNSTAGTGAGAGERPYLSCPGQATASSDVFYFTLFDQPNYLNWYNGIHSTPQTLPPALPYNSQFKCYDAMKIANQIQPAPYDGKYIFPSSLGINPTTGKLLATKGSTNGVASSMNGTNCTICVANPDSTDNYRVGNPMLPPGKYVVEAIMPPGYEVEKEEDKNLLIGDNFIAPVTQDFGGVGGDVFIMPDQASVASMYEPGAQGYNGTNYQNSTTGEGLGNEMALPGFPGYTDPTWPCVGEQRVVPDYLSLFPQNLETAPFAGATRPLCDRKEVTLTNQMAANARFFIFTSTHIAAKYTGVITDDFTSEFDPFSPQFGEKFAPPNLPISTKDYLGNELSRVWSDHWGLYDGLTYSSWDVNPPNITGYSPAMMTQCMNDPGPILDTNPTSTTYGQMITDPLYNSGYSDFCYINPFMPGLTTYNDTPVIPTQAFVGAGYNNVDCSYPDATPAVSEVDGDGIGPWVSAALKTLTITALGNQQVNNNAYSGPSANVAPFNLKTVTRHYGFGARCTAVSGSCTAVSSVTIGGIAATINSWSDTQIAVTVPTGVANCAIQQQTQYTGSTAQCGELVITAGNGKQSIDTVTVTIGGKAPTHVDASASVQTAIDTAAPGDLIIVDPTCTTTGTSPATATCSSTALHATTPTQTASQAAHTEMLVMWKPVRLQGVGAASSVINANAFPAGRLLNPWRRHINCFFGLTLQGVPYTSTGSGTTYVPGSSPYDPNYNGTPGSGYTCPDAGWNNFTAQPNSPQIDRLPLESVVGWDAALNGNLAEQMQEPSLMGAFEGAGITVLAKGLEFHGQAPWSDGTENGAFPPVTTLLTGTGNVTTSPDTALAVGDANNFCHTVRYNSNGTVTVTSQTNPYPSNFMCNPSSIDGLSVINSSQGGGGIFAHGWAHHLQIANNRVYNNSGTLTGGISVGQGEFAGPYVAGGTTNAAPGSCSNGTGWTTNQHLPYCLQLEVNVHNNYVTSNSSLGDELFSATLAGGGGVTFCTGNDYYKFNYNWVCGNLSTGEGGGLVHLGEIQYGDIEHNSILFNQSQNPTIPTNGGGIQVMGTPDTDPVCGAIPDADCPPGLSDGTGHGLVINANLIQGNSADSGSGGGIRLQQVNGTEVSTFNTRPTLWNNVSITNNLITNNVAGWDGAGISLQDSLNVSIVNNTISSNDSLATSGVLTQSIGTPLSSSPAGNCVQPGPTGPTTASCPQVAGVASMQDSSLLTTTFAVPITCPTGQPNCTGFSNPSLKNNVIWQNRSFYIGVGNLGTGTVNQQNLVTLFDAFTGTAAPVQSAFGQCTSGVSYWDIGVRGDTGPSNHGSGFSLSPTYSILDDPADYSTGNNLGSNPSFVSQYCNGSRVPPNCTVADGCGGPSGYGVPPGIVDASTPNPVFSLTPSATVDEGNNWINVSWGPVAPSNDSVTGGANGNYGGGSPFANYTLAAGSPAIDVIPVAQTHPSTDFFGNPRPDITGTAFDVGAVEFQAATAAVLSVTPTSLTFTSQAVGTTSASQALTLHNTGTAAGTGIAIVVTAPFARPAGGAGGTCTATLAAGATCTINVTFTPTAAGAATGTATITANVTVTGSPVSLSGTGVAAVRTATVTPTSLTFGNQVAGSTSAAQLLTITNTGNVTMTETFTFGGGTPQPYARAAGGAGGTCGATIAAGASCTYGVRFLPAAAGTFPRTLSIAATGFTINTAASPFVVTLTGTGTAVTVGFAGPTPSLVTGTTTAHSGTVTITNSSGAAITPTSIAVTKVGGAGGTFAVGAGGTCAVGTPIANAGTCTVVVTYTPPTGSTTTATAHITLTDTLAGSAGTATQTEANFTAN
ncbi:MAG: choice-of-anchor D domain-containing protein [Acidobacteriota bacterium]|nr:choice-of-anchor D domain-containing protein [Acidobacteriota bacterium]